MKTKLSLLLLLSIPAGLYAAEAVVPATDAANSIVQFLTPVIVPLVIAGMKKLMPKLPGFLLPIIAPVIGVVIDLVNSFVTTHSTNLFAAAALGLAGVGLREVKDQLSKKPSEG